MSRHPSTESYINGQSDAMEAAMREQLQGIFPDYGDFPDKKRNWVPVLSSLILGVNPNTVPKSDTDHTPLHAALLDYCSTDIIHALVTLGADVNQMQKVKRKKGNGISQAALHTALRNCYQPTAAYAIPETQGGWDSLHYEQADRVNLLLSFGADPNLPDSEGYTPLALAAKVNNPHAVKALIDAGAEVGPKEHRPLHIAASHKMGQEFVITRENSAEAIALLLAAGADVTAKEDGLAPLHLACKHGGGPDVVRQLLIGGADIDAPDDQGNTPLHHAAGRNDKAMVDFLMAQGADPLHLNQDKKTPAQMTDSRAIRLSLTPTRDEISRVSPG